MSKVIMINVKNLIYIYFRKIVLKILKYIFRVDQSYNYKPLYNYFHYTRNRPKKLALLSYRVLQLREQSKKTWSSGGDVHDIIQVLSELGYKTDIIYSEDDSFIPKKKYDLLITHPGRNLKKLFTILSGQTVKILYLCGAYTKFQNKEEQKRIDVLHKKNSLLEIHAERFIPGDNQHEDFALKNSDGVILLSNRRGASTYPNPEKILNLEGASFSSKKYLFDLNKKDFSVGKNNFLILSGTGNIHKGLDLLLESFIKMPDKHLYICSKLEEDFKDIYKNELFNAQNIHYIGHIDLYKKQHFDIISKCNYLIFPSASEGSPGSVADCMVQGLIPLVSLNSHIDVNELGEYIEPCSVENISQVVREISKHNKDWYKERSFKIREQAIIRFSQKLYKDKLKKYILEIVNKKVV